MFTQWRRWIAYPIVWLALMLVPMAVVAMTHTTPSARSTPTNDLRIDSFDASYDAHRSGDGLAIDVTEKIKAYFPHPYTNHGIERQLPTTYGRVSMEVSGVRVTDMQGNAITWTSSTARNGDMVLRIGSAYSYVEGSVGYVIRYRIGNAMVLDPDGSQEIYLDVNGTGWLQTFTDVRARP